MQIIYKIFNQAYLVNLFGTLFIKKKKTKPQGFMEKYIVVSLTILLRRSLMLFGSFFKSVYFLPDMDGTNLNFNLNNSNLIDI